MNFIKLILRNLVRSKTRTALTLSSIAVCVFIFAALVSLDQGVRRMISNTGDERVLIVFERYKACPPYSKLPVHYVEEIADLSHVEAVMPVRFLLSNCGTTTDLVAVHGVEPAVFQQMRAVDIPGEQYTAFANERGAAIIGRSTADKYGWQVGQLVSLPQLRGVSFTVRGIFDAPGSSLEEVVLVDREYLERSIGEVGIATMFMVLVDDPQYLDATAVAIDAKFANFETQTKSGAERSFISGQIAGFKEIVKFSQLVAFLALLLLLAAVANSVSMGARDRLREMALLKLLGFESTQVQALILLESAVLGIIAALLGAGAAWWLIAGNQLSISVEGFTMYPHLPPMIFGLAVGVGLLLSVFGAWMPVYSAARRPIVLALRGVD